MRERCDPGRSAAQLASPHVRTSPIAVEPVIAGALSAVGESTIHREVIAFPVSVPIVARVQEALALRTIDPAVRVLLCSGYSQNGFAGIDELLRRGALGFIQKPFSRQNIGVAIKKALEGGPTKL